MRQLLSDPDTFFERETRQGRLRGPVLVVSLVGISFALQSVAIFVAVEDALDINSILTVNGILFILEPFFAWGVLTILFFVLAKIWAPTVNFGRLFRLTGWGFLPVVLSGIVWSIGSYLAFRGRTVPEHVRRGLLESEREGYEILLEEASADSTLLVGLIVGGLFIFAAGYFWTYAVAYSTDLPRRKIILVTAIPTLLYFVWSVTRIFI